MECSGHLHRAVVMNQAAAKPLDPQLLARTSPEFASFLSLAVRDSGMNRQQVQPINAHYRLLQPDGTVVFGLRYADQVWQGEARVPLATLIEPYLADDPVHWILKIWTCPDLQSLKTLLGQLPAVVRFERGADDKLHGHVIPATVTLPLIEMLQKGQYILDNQELVTDAITRTLGIRLRVVTLFKNERQRPPRAASPDDPATFNQTLVDWRK